MTQIYVDADGCPVKQEVCKVAKRYGIAVTFVANNPMPIGREYAHKGHKDSHKMVVVDGSRKLDAADDWIVEQAAAGDIVITGDIPLAARCLAKGAAALDHRGGAFTEEGIGHALAGRELMSHLRAMDAVRGGPAPFGPRERSKFLQRLDETIHAQRKRKPQES